MASEEKGSVIEGEQIDNTYRLWIDDDWYILVDAEGRCIGKCAEGALGFIVQLSSGRDESAVRALKIPRLVAETDRENAYIAELLAQELDAVRDVFDKPGGKSGLLGARDLASPLQRTIRIERIEEARQWDSALLFVRFEKGQNPFFCLMQPKEGGVFPPRANAPQIKGEFSDQIRSTSRTANPATGKPAEHWSQMVFLRVDQQRKDQETSGKIVVHAADQISIFSAADALATDRDSTAKTWYTCVPSVVYDWAPNTLQEAIGRGERGQNWSVDDHLQLMEQICKGIKVLHNKGMLHADIRPANIVYLGDPQNPTNYYLSDYGSFAHTNTRPLQAEPGPPKGGTIAGPVVEGERVSPFYAPERGSGRERETADTAIIVLKDTSAECYAIVGWKSEFIELGLLDEVSKPTRDADYYTQYINERRNQYSGDGQVERSLDRGDRVQLRDYIFELVEPEEILGNFQVFPCSPKFWTIYHGRIAIYEHRDRASCFAFPIPRVVELPQWSAATDIYSLGVLCLYSVYSELLNSNGRPVGDSSSSSDLLLGETSTIVQSLATEGAPGSAEPFVNQPPPDVPRPHTGGKPSTVKLDQDFEVMLKYMADKSLFRALWPQLEWLRNQIETKLVERERQKWTAETLANVLFQPKPETEKASKQQDKDDTSGAAEERTLQSETVKVISQITSTVPGIEHLLPQLSDGSDSGADMYQLGPFIFFLHFVLCCLNRKDSLDQEKLGWVEEGWMKAPFCEDRHDEPRVGGAADEALARLAEIRSIIKAGALKGLTTEKNNIAKFDLRPESEIRRELNALKDDKKKLGDQLENERNERNNLAEKLKGLSNIEEELTQTKLELEATKAAKEQACSEMAQSSAAAEKKLQEKIATDQAKIAQYERVFKALESAFNAAINKVSTVSGTHFLTNRRKVVDEMTEEFVNAMKQRPLE
jgi:serine/threonine protein kinase